MIPDEVCESLWFHAYISTILCLTLSRLSNNNGDPGFLSEWSWKFGIAFVDLLQNSNKYFEPNTYQYEIFRRQGFVDNNLGVVFW